MYFGRGPEERRDRRTRRSSNRGAGPELGVIAAAHAALDPRRRAQRADIIVESVLQVLRVQPLPEDRIVQELRRLWSTPSITPPLVRSALAEAQATNLAVPQTTLYGTDWAVIDEGMRDSRRTCCAEVLGRPRQTT